MDTSNAMAGMMHDPEAKAPPKKVHTMVITRTHKGHHVTHHHTSPSHHPATHHEVMAPEGNPGNLDNLHDHMEEHMGEPNEGEEAAEGGME